MARPVWTPIVAPDLGESAIRAQQASGIALNQAFAGIGSALDRYEGQRREADLAELAARQNRFASTADVAGYQSGLSDGSLVQGLSHLKSGDLISARSFAGDLRSARASDTAYTRGEQAFSREEADRASGLLVAREANAIRADLAAGLISPAQAQARSAALAQQTQNAGQVNASYDAGRAGVQDQHSSEMWNRDSWRFGNEQQRQQWTVEDRADARAAAATIEKFKGMGGTFTDLEASDDWKNANPQQRIMIREAFGATADPGPFAGSIDMDASRQAVVDHLAKQGASSAAIAGIMGNFEVEGGYAGHQGDNGTASGIAQWRGNRREAFKARFGKDPHQATPQEQAQFLTWELLSPEGRKVSGVTQEQAREIWTATDPGRAAELFDKYYERSDGAHRDRRIAAARSFSQPSQAVNQAEATKTAVNAATNLGTDQFAWMAKLPQAFGDTSSLASVAERITTTSKDGAGSPLAGQNKSVIQQELQRVQSDYARKNDGKKITPAAAAVILEQAVVPYGGLDFFDLNTRTLNQGPGLLGQLAAPFQQGGFALDRNQLRSTIAQIRYDNGNVVGLNNTVQRVQGNQADSTEVSTALQQVETLRNKLELRKSEDRRLGLNNNPATARLESQVLQAQAQLDQINGRARQRSQTFAGN